MPENNSNRLVMYLAGAVVVLLIAFVAVVMLNNGSKTAETTGGEISAPGTQTAMPGVGASTGFDKATATKVPSGKAPKDFVTGYYEAILAKKWDVAFKMQPAASQQGGSAEAFGQTQTGYGMKTFEVKSSTASDTEATVVVQQDLGTNGEWNATWTFVKDGGDWLVKERKVGMGAIQ